MTMSEQQQQKKKLKKSYAQLLEEFLNTKKRIAVVYIPLLCEALKDENPDWGLLDIRDKVVSDAVEQGWNAAYIQRCIPSYIRAADSARDLKHENALKAWEARYKNRLLEGYRKVSTIKENIPEPPEQKTKPIDEEFEYKMQEAHVLPYAETGKSIRELTGRMSKSGYDVIEAHSNNSSPPSSFSDFMNDYIKKSREFRKGLMLEVDENRRAELHNIFSMAVEMLEDTIEIIDEVDKR